MELEQTLENLGHYGRWQLMVFSFVVITLRVPCTWHIVSIALMGFTPTHHCKVPLGSRVSEYIPTDDNGKYLQCYIYTNRSTNEVSPCIDGWEFDYSQSGPTFTTKWNLVCSHKYFPSLSQLLFTLGLFFGGFTLMKPVEWFGSRRVYIISCMCLSACGLLTILLNSFKLFLFFRVLSGYFVGATLYATQKYLKESFSSKSRSFYDLLQMVLWSPGICICIGLSYLLIDWVHLQIAMDFYILISLPFHIWWLDESVTWLYNKNKTQKAEKNAIYIAKFNNINLDVPIFLKDEFDGQKNFPQIALENTSKKRNKSIVSVSSKRNSRQSVIQNDFNRGEFCKLINGKSNETWHFLTSVLTHYCASQLLIFGFILLICNLGFFGILMTSSPSPNHYLSFFSTAFVNFPACLCTRVIVKKFGYKTPTNIALLFSTIPMLACATSISLEEGFRSHFVLFNSIIFEFFIGAAFCSTSIYLEEVFPSYLRGTASIFCTTFGRIGTILASFCLAYVDLNPLAMYVSFALMSSFGGLLSMLLPDSPIVDSVESPMLLEDGEEDEDYDDDENQNDG